MIHGCVTCRPGGASERRHGTTGLRPWKRLALSAWAALALAACATHGDRALGLADAHGLQADRIDGNGFRHLVLHRRGRGPAGPSAPLHVYIEGDGVPWAARTRVSPDPTPRNPLALRLMLLDPGPSLYLGRPCYHGAAREPPCRPWLWTHGRYGDEVVEAMAAALARAVGGQEARPLTLIGYSGGGVLAMQLARRVPRVRTLVTIAANLDTDAWTELHGYSPLAGSPNPARMPALPARIGQLHIVGSRDTEVPPALARRALRDRPSARIREVAGADHRCCWDAQWPRLLELVRDLEARDVAGRRPGG
jgi:hypothetical protein